MFHLFRRGTVIDEPKLQTLVTDEQLHGLHNNRRDLTCETVECCLDECNGRLLSVAKPPLSELYRVFVVLLDDCLVVLDFLQTSREARRGYVVRQL